MRYIVFLLFTFQGINFHAQGQKVYKLTREEAEEALELKSFQDTTGKFGFYYQVPDVVVIPAIYDDAKPFEGSTGAVKLKDKWFFINQLGEEQTDLKFNDVTFDDAWIGLKNDIFYFYTYEGKRMSALTYAKKKDNFSYGNFSEDLYGLKFQDKFGFIDTSGMTIIPFQYDKALQFSDGLAAVFSNNHWGFIDKSNHELLSTKYTEVQSFGGGLVPVMLNDKWGCIDKSGNEIIPLQYDAISSFDDNKVAIVVLNKKHGLIDTNGKVIVPIEYDYVDYYYQGTYPFSKYTTEGTQTNFFDKTGKQIKTEVR